MSSVYKPVLGHGYSSVLCQQLQYSMKFERGWCPRELLLEDLGGDIIKWEEEDDSIVVMEDWNQDIICNVINEWEGSVYNIPCM